MLPLHHSKSLQACPSLCTPICYKTCNKTARPPRDRERDLRMGPTRSKRWSRLVVVGAVEKDSEFEVDPIKAREALRKLDEELQSLSQKKIDPPKIRASDLDRARGPMTEESEEISGSFLINLAAGLVIFTIFYNILFLTVIKPAIDGPDDVEVTSPVMEAK